MLFSTVKKLKEFITIKSSLKEREYQSEKRKRMSDMVLHKENKRTRNGNYMG